MKCAFCNKDLEQDNNTHFCDEQCEYDFIQEHGTAFEDYSK